MTNRTWVVKALLALSVVALCAPAFAAENWVGTWTVNLAKSKYSPGPPPKEWTLTFERTPAGIKLTSAGVDGRGKQSMTFVSSFDGTEVKWVANPDADACAPLRMSDNVYVNVNKKGGKLLHTVRVEASADGKTLTVTQTGTINNVVLYDRKP